MKVGRKSLKNVTVALASLGCAKNTVDSEHLLGLLTASGCILTSKQDDAEVIIVNTCGFLKAARDEAIRIICEMNASRERGKLKMLVVTGCMAQKDKELLKSECPFIDLFIPPFELSSLPGRLRGNPGNGNSPKATASDLFGLYSKSRRISIISPAFAYVKIADGCNNRCSYCRIPYLRGVFRSRRIPDIVSEVSLLVKRGVREIVLVSQDSSRFGEDQPRIEQKNAGDGITHLLQALDELPELVWLRLMYTNPERITDELIRSMNDLGSVCRYLDMPIQHVDPGILKNLNRSGDGRFFRKLIERIRERIPGVTIRSTFMTGFPFESKTAFRNLKKFLSEGWIDHAGVFSFSPEPNTPLWNSGVRKADPSADSRRNELMAVQQEQVIKRNRNAIGTIAPVLVDEFDDRNNRSVCRTEGQAPEIDGCVYVEGEIPVGTLLPIQVYAFDAYDLYGKPMICETQRYEIS